MSWSERLRILIVDDDPIDRETYRRLLLRAPDSQHEVLEAETAEEGLALCRLEQPDCVLLDYLLPDLDGLAFLAALRAGDGITPVPVIMLTGQGNPSVDVAAIRAGAQDYLVKGEIGVDMLVRTIRHAMDRHQLLAALRNSEARVRTILDTAADGIITFDRQGFIISLNPAAEPLFGYTAGEVLGQPVQTLLPDLFREVPALSPARRPAAEAVRVHRELVARRRDGGRVPVDLTISEARLGEERIFTAVVRDVSERRQAEQAQRLFLAATSHDMRNALTTILGYVNILQTRPGTPEAAKAVTRIANLVRNLSTVMNDIVLHAGTNEETINVRPTEVRSVVANCARDVREECKQRGLQLRTELPPEECIVFTDRTALARILLNLLTNAVRYTPQGEVVLRCEVESHSVRFTVQDTGIGIPPEDLTRVFEDHYRHPHARELQPLGTGLGLATAKRLCALLRGTISVKSEPGKGSTFTVTLPRDSEPSTQT